MREVTEALRDAGDAADRVRDIIRDLRIFSRSDEVKTEPVDLRRVIESSLRLAWNEIRHRARLIKDYGDVPRVDGNEGRLGQVFLNLVVNAAQAIPEGRADQHEIRIVTRRDGGGRVVVEVRDTGPGIPESVLPRIFDPFFTTKRIGEGTGLGLAICQRIVTAHRGALTVESAVGKGSVFRVSLPAASRDEVPVSVVAPAVTSTRRARILVVDDEAMLRTALRRSLAPSHDVLCVENAREAVTRISSGERFDVILCDLMMPEMTGMDLHAELSRTTPELADRMIFMTGGAFTRAARDFLSNVSNHRAEKPFEAGNIRALIDSVLGGRS